MDKRTSPNILIIVVTPPPMLCSEGYAYSSTRIPHLQIMGASLVNISALAIKDVLVGIQIKIIHNCTHNSEIALFSGYTAIIIEKILCRQLNNCLVNLLIFRLVHALVIFLEHLVEMLVSPWRIFLCFYS